MPEAMWGQVLLMTAFFGAVVLLVTAVSPLIYEGLNPGASVGESLIVDEYFENNMYWDRWEPDVYTVTDADQSNGYYPENDIVVTFDAPGGDEHPLESILVRNASRIFQRDTADYWMFQQHYGWFGGELARECISLDEIKANYDEDTNCSVILLNLRYSMKVVFWVNNATYEEESFGDRIDANYYNISAGCSSNDTMESVSPWTIIGKLMTFRMPGMNIVTNALIAIPIYITLIYMAFAIIRSVIPLLG